MKSTVVRRILTSLPSDLVYGVASHGTLEREVLSRHRGRLRDQPDVRQPCTGYSVLAQYLQIYQDSLATRQDSLFELQFEKNNVLFLNLRNRIM